MFGGPETRPPAPAGTSVPGILRTQWRRLLLPVSVLALAVLISAACWYLFWPVPDARTTAENYIGANYRALSSGLAELALPGDPLQDELQERILDDFEYGDVAWGCRTRDNERDRGREVEVTCVVRIDVRRPLSVYMEAPVLITVDMDRDAFRPSPKVLDAVLWGEGAMLEIDEMTLGAAKMSSGVS